MKWEYAIERLKNEAVGRNVQTIGITKIPDPLSPVTDMLERRGQEGWELIAVTGPIPGEVCNPPTLALYYFKRPKS